MVADVPDKGSPHDRARIVRRYLSALDARKPGRTGARTAESIHHRIHQIDTQLLSADPVQRLHLTQERIDLHSEQLRLTTSSGGDFDALEKAFTRIARAYGDRHDITYSAWRQVGVDNEVLGRAGITPAPKPARPQATAKPAVEAAPESAAPPAAEPAVEPVAEKPKPEAKKAPAKKAAAKKTGPAKKAPAAKKAAQADPAQQRLPAEAHLLS